MKTKITKNNGEIVAMDYLTRRVEKYLAGRWSGVASLDLRKKILDQTIRDKQWMKQREGQTVRSICRAVEVELLNQLNEE